MSSVVTNQLQRAIKYLGATEVTEGAWAFQLGNAWYVRMYAEMEQLDDYLLQAEEANDNSGRYLASDRKAAFMLWFEAEVGRMPGWWSPQAQFAWRHKKTGSLLYGGFATQSFDRRSYNRIAANLETGAEVPA